MTFEMDDPYYRTFKGLTLLEGNFKDRYYVAVPGTDILVFGDNLVEAIRKVKLKLPLHLQEVIRLWGEPFEVGGHHFKPHGFGSWTDLEGVTSVVETEFGFQVWPEGHYINSLDELPELLSRRRDPNAAWRNSQLAECKKTLAYLESL